MIVIPMAGNSSRFFKAGYLQPKYELKAHGKSLFDHSVESFEEYFALEEFLFITSKRFNAGAFVKKRAKALGIQSARVVELEETTRGQAETVYVGLKGIDPNEPITIFNIDTFRPNYRFPKAKDLGDGFLEVFEGDGDNWSYAAVEPGTDIVVRTTEKNPISNLCSTGLYHFRNMEDFSNAFLTEANMDPLEWDAKELYVAPLYNHLIAKGKEIRVDIIDRAEVIFCGTPEEYLEFQKI